MPSDFREEVSSWDSMKEALRLEDRIRMRDLINRAAKNATAMEVVKEEFQTESFFLLLLLEQYRTIKELDSKLEILKKEKMEKEVKDAR